jgi:hypothetical protein
MEQGKFSDRQTSSLLSSSLLHYAEFILLKMTGLEINTHIRGRCIQFVLWSLSSATSRTATPAATAVSLPISLKLISHESYQVFLCQRLNTATSSPANDIIPQSY